MGSLVMSQVAPGLTQHSHSYMMVADGLHQHEPSDPNAMDSQERTTSAVSSARAAPSTSIPATPRSPELEPQTAQQASDATVTSQSGGSGHVHSPENHSDRPPTASYMSHDLNQHSRGYDQSGFPLAEPRGLASSSPSSPRLQPTYRSARSLGGSEASSPSRIKVKNLSHIQSFASEEFLARPRAPRSGFFDQQRQFEISAMPVTDIIEMVAGLLTKITTTNDQQHEHVHRPLHPQEDQNGLNPQAQCVLAFHGKNVPSITILSYLSRIHKYCPTTYEVFLSLLVYFDRMTENVNKGLLRNFHRPASHQASSAETPRSPIPMEVDSAQRADEQGSRVDQSRSEERSEERPPNSQMALGHDLSQVFVVDSYNIHRLVIAGVTCASKFFSDVFYTNSRYAKVIHFYIRNAQLTNCRLGVCRLQSSTIWSFNFWSSTTFGFRYQLKSLKPTAQCLWNSMRVRSWLSNKQHRFTIEM